MKHDKKYRNKEIKIISLLNYEQLIIHRSSLQLNKTVYDMEFIINLTQNDSQKHQKMPHLSVVSFFCTEKNWGKYC